VAVCCVWSDKVIGIELDECSYTYYTDVISEYVRKCVSRHVLVSSYVCMIICRVRLRFKSCTISDCRWFWGGVYSQAITGDLQV